VAHPSSSSRHQETLDDAGIVIRTSRECIGKNVVLSRLVVHNEVVLDEEREPSCHALREMGALHRGSKRSVVRVHSERLLAGEVHYEFDQSVAHREEFLVVHGIVILRRHRRL